MSALPTPTSRAVPSAPEDAAPAELCVSCGRPAADSLATGVLAIAFGVYVTLALRRAYGDGWVAAFAKAAALWLGLGVVLSAYRFVLFFTTLWTT
jgi:hypothetical protein